MTAKIATGKTAIVVAGFAAGMTGEVKAAEFGEVLGWRYLVALPGYGPRWFGESFVEPFEG